MRNRAAIESLSGPNLESKAYPKLDPGIRNQKWAWILAIGFILIVVGKMAHAQQPAKIARIGYLAAGFAPAAAGRVEAFRTGLRSLGYIEGKNVVIEYRNAAGKIDQVPQNAAELVRLPVDIIVTAGPIDTKAAKQATKTIPIVMSQDNDPVGNGFVASLARPGGNITGLSNLSPELSGKRLELLKEIFPNLSRVAVFGTSTTPGNSEGLKETQLAAAALGINVRYVEISTPDGIESAFQSARNANASAILIQSSPVLTERKEIARLALKTGLPAMYTRTDDVTAGGLISYGVSLVDLDRRAAVYVDKILKGAKPAELPIEQPTKFELIINLKTAQQIGVKIPPNVLARADKVIK